MHNHRDNEKQVHTVYSNIVYEVYVQAFAARIQFITLAFFAYRKCLRHSVTAQLNYALLSIRQFVYTHTHTHTGRHWCPHTKSTFLFARANRNWLTVNR